MGMTGQQHTRRWKRPTVGSQAARKRPMERGGRGDDDGGEDRQNPADGQLENGQKMGKMPPENGGVASD